jgi:glycosyltransferase involved in cell wall biosynthesis
VTGGVSVEGAGQTARAGAVEASLATDRLPASSDLVLVHDYLNQRGGAERVVAEMASMFPTAPLYTSIYRPQSTWDAFLHHEIRTSPLQLLPVDQHFRRLFPLYPPAFRSFGQLDADVVISSSSGWAHAVRTTPGSFHAVYCYSPARWLYTDQRAQSGRAGELTARALAPYRHWDQAKARKADLYIAISDWVRRRIARVYGIAAPVVYPPVDVSRFTPTPRGERLLVVSRLLDYKRVDVIVRAASEAEIGLDVVGTGPELERLKALAGPQVVFHGGADDGAVTELIEGCRALCIAGCEDFGITPVEAQAAGKPVVAFAAGGALETVTEGLSGSFFDTYRPEAVTAAIRRCDDLETSPQQLAALAERFSAATFRRQLVSTIEEARSDR